MLAARPEENGHAKSDDCSETDPPGKFYGWQPIRSHVGDAAEDSSNRIEEITDDRHDEKSDDHRDDVAKIVAPTAGKHSAKKNAEDRTISVGEDAQHDRNDAKIRGNDDQIGSERRNDNHQDREPDCGPAHGAQNLFTCCGWIYVVLVPITSETGGQRVYCGAERAHRSRETSGDQKSVQTDRHLVENKMAEDFRWFRKIRFGMSLVIGPEQNANAEKGEDDWYIGETGHDEGPPAAADVRRGQHSLHHVLIGPVRGHGHESRSNQAREDRVLDLEHAFPSVPTAFRGIESGCNNVGELKAAVKLGDFVPAAGDRKIKQTESGQRAADHD